MTDLLTLPSFTADDTFYVVVESPRGSTSKFKYDVNHRVMILSRPLPQGLAYPHDWGFVPSTRAPDGDPLDAIIVWDGVSYPGIAIECRPIGLLQVEQTKAASPQRERNDRLIALPTKAPRWESIRTVFDLGERVRLDLEFFFQAAVTFEGKALKILGWDGPKGAMALVRAAAAAVK